MGIKILDNIKNEGLVNLEGNVDETLVLIENSVSKVTITSNNEPCNARILVKSRDEDLIINIQDLILKSKNDIALDFAAGINNNYKNYLNFFGNNIISSEKNIGICITNNQRVEIKGEDNSFLRVESGTGFPCIGNDLYNQGAGTITFGGYGDVEIIAGCNNKNQRLKGEKGASGIEFNNEDENEVSTIKILESINLKVMGEDGEDIAGISLDNKGGNGGSAIRVKNSCIFNKFGTGNLELVGGDGGCCTREYSAGNCGDGGNAIFIGNGEIFINEPATLKSGNGGYVEDRSIGKGGYNADVVLVSGSDINNDDKEVNIKISSNVNLELGDNGLSRNYIYKDSTNDNRDKGNLINTTIVNAKIYVGDINFNDDINPKEECINKYVGENISFVEEEINIDESGSYDNILDNGYDIFNDDEYDMEEYIKCNEEEEEADEKICAQVDEILLEEKNETLNVDDLDIDKEIKNIEDKIEVITNEEEKIKETNLTLCSDLNEKKEFSVWNCIREFFYKIFS